MKRILFYLLGLLLIIGGIALETGIMAGIFGLLMNPWVCVGALVVVFSCVIGDRIYRYGFKPSERMYQEEDNNISL